MPSFESYNGNIDTYLSGLRAPLATWGFVHIAKTAGTSLITELHRKFPPYYNIYADYKLGFEANYHVQMGKAIERFLSTHRTRPQRCFSGHISMIEARAIKEQLPGSRFFTFLRDPAERVVSQYRYSLTAAEPNHVQFSARYSTVEEYVADPTSQNLIYRLLSPWPGATAVETATFAINFFDFIGLTEVYTISASIIFDLMGHEHVPTTRINVTDENRSNKVDLTPALRSLIMERNNPTMSYTTRFAIYYFQYSTILGMIVPVKSVRKGAGFYLFQI